MSSGGARNRSGPRPDPSSGRSERRGLTYRPLPPGGYDGPVPEFPMPGLSDRELALWEWAWRTPQAAAWADEPWRWYTVAEWVRWSVKAEADDAGAAVIAAKIRLADQLGLTPAGLRENGWTIAEPDAPADDAEAASFPTDVRSRLRGA